MSEEKKDAAQNFELVLSSAAQLPGVRIDRERYLAGALSKKFSPEVISTAIGSSPAAAGIKPEELSPIADASIRYESTKVTAISAAAGIPGGFVMAGTVPADLAQYFAHVLRISQSRHWWCYIGRSYVGDLCSDVFKVEELSCGFESC